MQKMGRNLLYYLLSGTGGRIAALIAVPVYIKVLGIESYGLIGFYLLLISSAQLVELGLGTSVARRLAELREKRAHRNTLRRIAVHVGARYGLVVASLATVLLFVARPFMVRYVGNDSLNHDLLSQAIGLMIPAVVAHLAINYLTSLLVGLERHFLVSAVRFAQIGLLQLIGAVAVFLDPRVATYFVTQLIGMASLAVIALWLCILCFRQLPEGNAEVTESATIGRGITAGIALTSFLGFTFSQIDRIILSGAISLREFGYYSLAYSVVNTVSVLVIPTFNVLLPAFSRINGDDRAALHNLYRQAYWITQAMLLPAIAILVFLPVPALWAWTGDSQVSAACAPLVQLLAIGALAQGLTNPAWMMLLGIGQIRAEIVFHIALVALTPPALLYALRIWGPAGAALVIASAHLFHLIAQTLYINPVFFKSQAVLSRRSLACWLLVIPAAAAALFSHGLGRYQGALLVVVSFGIPALIGLAWAIRRLRMVSALYPSDPANFQPFE